MWCKYQQRGLENYTNNFPHIKNLYCVKIRKCEAECVMQVVCATYIYIYNNNIQSVKWSNRKFRIKFKKNRKNQQDDNSMAYLFSDSRSGSAKFLVAIQRKGFKADVFLSPVTYLPFS